MKFTFHDAHAETGHRPAPYDVLLGLVAVFEIVVGAAVLYSEIDLPIVELAVALKKWLSSDLKERSAFEYASVEADESGMVWIRPEEHGWRIGSIHQEFVDPTVRSDDEVDAIARGFIDEVAAELLASTGQILPEP
jgi:hypothetical protein